MSLKRKPEFRHTGPIWWHHHGSKMYKDDFRPEGKRLTIANNVAHLSISVHGEDGDIRIWRVEWDICHDRGGHVNGYVSLYDGEMELAFGLREEDEGAIPAQDHWLFQRYGCESARQFGFIRWDKFLNIPCPGTGNDGDPNISVMLDREIQEAVRRLIHG